MLLQPRDPPPQAVDKPAGAAAAAERGAASQEAATLGDGELRETHVEPSSASSRAAESTGNGGQADVVLAQGVVDTEIWSGAD